jgi:hypothetical protein
MDRGLFAKVTDLLIDTWARGVHCALGSVHRPGDRPSGRRTVDQRGPVRGGLTEAASWRRSPGDGEGRPAGLAIARRR